ncbi:hypothetical protein FRB96_001714 [Tulasnella sp. 330]|nr:hypothetical protein FRB96_001714 [Tulasnella sp. 330]
MAILRTTVDDDTNANDRATRHPMCPHGKYWDNGKARGETVPTMVFRYPRGSITWLHIICSRWLVIGLKTGSLDLVDLENDYDDPVARFRNLKGHVACGVTTTADERVVLTANTKYATDVLLFHERPLPGSHAEQRPRRQKFRSASENLPAIVDRKLRASVSLARGANVTKAQYTVGIPFRSGIVVIAKDWNIEIYSMNDVAAALLRSSMEGTVQYVSPLQSLPYPGNQMI